MLRVTVFAASFAVTFAIGEMGFSQTLPVENIELSKPQAIANFFRDVFSSNPKVTITDGGTIVLKGSDEIKTRDVLIGLGERLGLENSMPNNLALDRPVNITKPLQAILPQFPFDQTFAVNGVNCHGTSLLAAGILDQVSYVSNDELEHTLHSKCVSVEGATPGSIGIIGRNTMLSHSFYVLSRNLILEKRSLSAKSNFKIHYVSNMPRAEYFYCEKANVVCSTSAVLVLQTRVSREEQFYAEFLSTYAGLPERRAHEDNLRDLLQIATRLHTQALGSTCNQLVADLKYRLISLNDLMEQLSGAGLFYNQREFTKPY